MLCCNWIQVVTDIKSVTNSDKGLSIKDVRSQGEGLCPVWTFFGQGGRVLQMPTSALFGAKNFGFF